MKVLFFHRNAEWLGIEYLSSVLKNAGHQTELLFDPGSGDIEYRFKVLDRFFDVGEKMVRRAEEYSPDLIAFSCLTNLYPWVSKMAGLIKQRMDVPIIVGGIHPTILPAYVIKNPNIDMICVGEGEEAMLELVNGMQKGDVDYSTRNIWFKRDGEVVRNPSRPLIQDLDSLPFPDKDGFRKYGCFSDRLYVMSGRGCPHQCTYCFNSHYRKLFNISGKPYVRRRSVENVISELRFFKDRYKIKEVFFYDDIFTINEDWVRRFCEIYKRDIRLPFKIMVHPQAVKKDTMRQLAEAGCIYTDIGIESGNEELRRKLLKRNMSNEDIVNTSRTLKEVGIRFCTLNIVGFPTETREQMWQTYDLNRRIKPDGTIMTIFYPFPHTELTDFCLQNGFLRKDIYERICNGESALRKDTDLRNMKEGSLLQNVEVEEAKRLQVLIPILTKTPDFLHPLIKRIPINAFTRVVSIFFLSIGRNLYIRMKESITMFIRSQYIYSLAQDKALSQSNEDAIGKTV
ncbi:MAG: radical SAM protein [Candidatus Omnitrophica bacterium]|nr:radical SAM protein [Candidatus Omnitrophota bacterium]